MGRDYEPVKGQWYEDLDDNEMFKVTALDPDAETVEVLYEDGETELVDLDTWHELDLEKASQPEGWSDEMATEDDEEEWEDEDDWEDGEEDDDDELDDDLSDNN